MTVKEAFAQAFDEAFVMDAAPSGLSSNPGKAGNSNAAKAKGMGSGMAAAAEGAEKSIGPQKSLAEHKQEGCDAEKNGHPERCPYVQRMTKDFESQGMSHEQALQKALSEHGSGSISQVQQGKVDKTPDQVVQAAAQGQQMPPQKGMQPQGQPMQPTPEMLEQQAQQIAQNPQLMDQIPSAPLPTTKEVPTEVGGLPAQTTVQEGILENLTEQAASGNTVAEESLQELKSKVDNGTITSSPPPVQPVATGEQAQQPEGLEQPQDQPVEPQPPKQRLYTSDGKFSRELLPEEVAVITANPEKKEILQSMVDIEAKASAFENGSPEFKDLAKEYSSLKRLFDGESPSTGGGGDGGSDEPPQVPPAFPPDDGTGGGGGGGGGGDGSTPPPEGPEPPTGEGSQEPKPTDNNEQPTGGEEEKEEEKETTPTQEQTPQQPPASSYEQPQAPSDEDFRIGKDKYKVGGNVYTDVSGKGLLHTMISSFMAGLRGEGIITGWDRISGAWDQMKRSEKGEMVRDGIAGALLKNTIAGYAAKEGLSDDARMELAAIQDMVSRAKTPKDNMAAVKQFQSWKEKYAKELGEMDKPKLGEPFKPLPNDYKGGKPPVSILDAPKDFDADKAFGDKVATVLQESLGAQGLPVGDLESISVGPSATTIEFKVDSTFDITAAQSKKVLSALHGALGSPVSKIDWVDGKTHVIAVQVTNQKMRDVSFSACIASDEWNDFADKAALPVTLGKDSSGKNVNLDLSKQPHTIVTGESGSGKSVFLMAAINSLEMAKTPDEARLVLLDPKNEFRSQDGSPHLLYPRAQKPQDIANVVSSLKSLMDERIEKIGGVVQDFDPTKNEFQGNSDRNITEYNKQHPDEKMPHILMTFDEVASIMKNPDVSDRVKQDLSQILALGRSVGINCLLATQRADVASIPGDIKANAPASIAFKAAPDDAKASAAAKSLAGSGDFIMTDKEGKQTRGRGCFISDKEIASVPAYYRDNMTGAPKPADGEGEADGGEGPKLPQEHLDVISAAVKRGNSVSMVATEGYMDAFKNAFPSDWEITEEEVNGEKHWKASPPSKPTGGTEGSTEPKAEENVDKAPTDEPKEENTDWRKDGSRDEAISTLSKVRDAAKAKAWDTYNQGEDTADAQKKLQKALEKADSDFNTKMALVDMKFPPPVDESMDGDSPEQGEEGEPQSQEGNSDDDEDSPAATMKDIEETFNAERERIEKALAKPNTKVRDKQKLREQRKALKQRFKEAKEKFEAGGSAEDMLNIFEPEEKPADKGGTEPQEQQQQSEQPDEEKAAQAQQEQAQKDEKLKASVRPQKFYNSPGFKATQKVTPQQVKQMENLLPAGWEFVTDNQFKAPARTQNGVVFIHNPQNGSYGRIVIKKDAKGKDIIPSEAQIDIDTSHPDYEGFTKNEDGSMSVGPKAKAVKAAKDRLTSIANATKMVEEKVPSKGKSGEGNGNDTISRAETFTEALNRAVKEGRTTNIPPDIIERINKGEELDFNEVTKELTRQYNNYAYGHDEAPDNMTIVANAVANVLERMETRT